MTGFVYLVGGNGTWPNNGIVYSGISVSDYDPIEFRGDERLNLKLRPSGVFYTARMHDHHEIYRLLRKEYGHEPRYSTRSVDKFIANTRRLAGLRLLGEAMGDQPLTAVRSDQEWLQQPSVRSRAREQFVDQVKLPETEIVTGASCVAIAGVFILLAISQQQWSPAETARTAAAAAGLAIVGGGLLLRAKRLLDKRRGLRSEAEKRWPRE